MINYKLYIKALAIIEQDTDYPTSEQKAEAICELFDIKQANEYLWNPNRVTTTPVAGYPRDAFWTPIPY